MDMSSRQISNVLQNGAPVTSQVGAYNTYVGARYVPIFDGEWDATKQYEPLVIVTNGGDSYTSKQYVPAGTPVTNETFWAHTGNWNGQLESLRQEVINNTISINTMDNQIDDLESKVYDDYYLCIADSYGDTLNDSISGWPSHFKNLMNLSDSQITVLQESSAGFVKKGIRNHNYQDLFNTLSPDVLNKISVVIVQTAGNDFIVDMQANYIASLALSFYNTNRSKMPRLKRFIFLPCFFKLNTPFNERRQYFECTKMINIDVPATLPTFYRRCNLFQSDGLHLTDSGYEIFAINLIKYIKGYNYTYSEPLQQYTFTNDDISGNIYTSIENGNIFYFINAAILTSKQQYVIFPFNNTITSNITSMVTACSGSIAGQAGCYLNSRGGNLILQSNANLTVGQRIILSDCIPALHS